MKIHIQETVEMDNKTKIIVHNVSVVKITERYSSYNYLIRIDGMFKKKWQDNFEEAFFTVPLCIEDRLGIWAIDSDEADTFNFFDLSYSDKATERAQFLHHCLTKDTILNTIKKDFGETSDILRWIIDECPVTTDEVDKLRT
ncbi:hypothetical protein QUF99_01430 [Bacillus sp. DX4.1]|uniref:hypothetical protein n=1 Tax=Bacillus sp. DX4.1 TaxID=3055867 RepID=UPI0025A0D91D|nr:hypothetical protein [Bacillus sp. DX4.1]MDM5186128.1 hypothetical protein [Bacillus sp. DX4.1]